MTSCSSAFLLSHWRHFLSLFTGWPLSAQYLNIILKGLVLGFLLLSIPPSFSLSLSLDLQLLLIALKLIYILWTPKLVSLAQVTSLIHPTALFTYFPFRCHISTSTPKKNNCFLPLTPHHLLDFQSAINMNTTIHLITKGNPAASPIDSGSETYPL